MKKKTVKKLELAKETVRTLVGSELADVVHGGISGGTASCQWNCFHTNQQSCLC
jgi:hypothetical protein